MQTFGIIKNIYSILSTMSFTQLSQMEKCEFFGTKDECPVAQYYKSEEGKKLLTYLDSLPDSEMGIRIKAVLCEDEVAAAVYKFISVMHQYFKSDGIDMTLKKASLALCHIINEKLIEKNADFMFYFTFNLETRKPIFFIR